MRVLSAVAKVALVVGTVGSVGLMLRVGGHKTSGILLLLLFGVWVIAPFVGLAWIGQIARHWPERSQAMLCGLTLASAVSSLAIYGEAAFGPPQPKPAAFFLMVPPGSWLAIAVFVVAARIGLRRGRG